MGILGEWNFTGGLAQIDGGMAQIEGGMSRIGGNFIRRLSYQSPGLAGKWKPYITSFTSPIRKMDYYYGGYSKFDFGEIELALKHFTDAGKWPPGKKASLKLWYTPGTEANAELLFDGVANRQSVSLARGVASYQLKSAKYGAKLLCERENYNGDVVAMPRGFGAFAQRETVRLPDVDGRHHYWLCHAAGAIGSGIDIFDDGVNINSKAVIPGYDPYVFYLTSPAVGTVTISATGDTETLDDVVAWLCTGNDDEGNPILNLDIDTSMAESPSPALAHFETGQQLAIDWFSEACSFFAHFFYIEGETMYLVDFDSDNGTRTLTPGTYSDFEQVDLPAVSILKANWDTFQAVEETVGKFVKTISNETSLPTLYTFGDEKSVKVFNTDRAVIDARLAVIETILNGQWAEISRPLDGGFPDPGKKYTLLETRGALAMTAVIRARELRYDLNPKSPKIFIKGNGTIS